MFLIRLMHSLLEYSEDPHYEFPHDSSYFLSLGCKEGGSNSSWRKLHNEELQNMYSLPDRLIIMVIE
jgi:hypothetical protein